MARLKWDKEKKRYRTPDGKVVASRAQRKAIGDVVADTSKKLARISQQFADGKINLREWNRQFKETINRAHTLAASVAQGGKRNMSAEDLKRLESELKFQFSRLRKFSADIRESGKINKGRVELYARSVRNTYLNSERLNHAGKLARWVRTKAESCADCIGQAARGLLPVDEFPSIGSLRCMSNCGCYLSFGR